MPFGVGDVVSLNVSYTLAGQLCRNIYWYQIATASDEFLGEEIGESFAQWIADNVAIWQTTSVQYERIQVDNWTDGLSFGEYNASGVNGLDSAPTMPSYVAVGYVLLRGSKLTNNGYKRIAGFSEDLTSGNDWNPAAGQYSNLVALSDELAEPVDLVGAAKTGSMIPIIVRRPDSGNIVTVFQPVIGAQLQNGPTSQVTRKKGRGE